MKTINQTVETIDNGNIVFSYEVTKYNLLSYRLIIPLVILFSLNIYEITITGKVYTLIITFILGLLVFYRWASRTEKKNENEERQIIYENLENIIEHDIKTFGENTIEIERQYIIQENKIDVTRYLKILLSNGKEIKYDIINPKRYNRIQVLEIDVTFKIIT